VKINDGTILNLRAKKISGSILNLAAGEAIGKTSGVPFTAGCSTMASNFIFPAVDPIR